MSKHLIEYGLHRFDDDSISEGRCRLVMSPVANSLEVNTFDAIVKSSVNLEEGFKRNTKLTYTFNDGVLGVFYVQKIKQQTSISYKISATSVIGILSEGVHYGGIYSGIAAKDLIAEICGNVKFSIKTSLQNIKLYGHLPIASRRDNLIQVLIAIGAVVKTDRLGVVQITGLYDQPTGVVDADNLSSSSAPQVDSPVTDLTVIEHQFIQSDTAEPVVLFEGNALQGDIIRFTNPVYDLQANGITIIESNVNYAKVAAGSGSITGKEYRHTKREVTRHLSDAEFSNVKRVEDATLVSLVNSSVVADNIARYLSRYHSTISSDAKHTGYFPGDIVKTVNPRSLQDVDAFVSEVELTLGSFLRAKGSWINGYVPHKSGADEFLSKRILLTEDTTWTVPNGVKSIRVVIIGGGDTGTWGTGGTSGTSGGNGRTGSSGQSGEPGQAGSGGKVYELTLDVTEGQQFQVKIGAGGTIDSTKGLPTTFGEHSSESGQVSQYGYIDVTTGEIFANPGNPGIKPEPLVTKTNISQYSVYAVVQPDGRGSAGTKKAATASDSGVFATLTYLSQEFVSGTTYNSYQRLRITGGATKEGATPIDADSATNYGGGGSGGHGGQGGMGGQGYSVVDIPKVSYGGASWNIIYEEKDLQSTSGSRGGNGGRPGIGKQGCVIVYYNEKKEVQSGYVKDKNGRILLDSTGRLIVV